MWPDSRLTEMFGIEDPIIQAPMAGSSSLDMAIAVSTAGGLGSIACAAHDAEALREALTTVRQRSNKPFNVNFFAHPEPAGERNAAWLDRLSGYFDELTATRPMTLQAGSIQPFDDVRCAVVEALRPAVVSFHFGLPDVRLVDRIRRSGAKVISSATTVAEAEWLAANGCDAIIAQGAEAGGHRGMFLGDDIGTQMGTLALVPQVVDAVDVPVIAAGGIADGRGVAAALALGASAVQVGTAYLLTREAALNPLYRERLRHAGRQPTALTNVFSGRPARCLVNRAMRDIGPMAVDAVGFPFGFAAMAPLKTKAEEQGSPDFSAHYCGQAVGLARETTAGQLTRELADTARERVKYLAAVMSE